MGSFVGIIYGISDQRIHQIVASDKSSDATLDAQVLGPDERMIKVPVTLTTAYSNIDDLAHMLGLRGLDE